MRAIGIVRQSKGREDSLSPAEQRARLEDACERDGHELLAVHEEIDVSGGNPLERREGLGAAVAAVEANQAEVVMVAYFDRLFRSLRVQGEVVARVEEAGGRVVALDFGDVSEKTAVQWLSGTIMGAFSEYYRRSVKERSGAAQAMAVAEGRIVFPNVTPGYVVGEDGRLAPGPDAGAVAEAFRLRSEGAPIREVRAFLRQHGIDRSYSTITRLLGSRVVLGELNFGELHNAQAHPAIVERDVWEAVQRVRETRGVKPKSDRLLARLGVLRCGTCGARMSVGFRSTRDGVRYDFYRCPPVSDCPRRTTIAADMVEGWIVERVKQKLAGLTGRAAAEDDARAAEGRVEEAQARLDGAIRALAELRDEPAAIETLAGLRAARDEAIRERDHLRGLSSAYTVTVEDWDDLTLDGRRGLVRATVERVEVAPGRGLGRVTATFLVE